MVQTHRNQFSKDAISKKKDEFFLQLAREFYDKHESVPLSTDLGLQVRKVIYRRFKTWQNFIGKALNLPAKQRNWTDNDLLDWLRALYDRLGRFPTHTEIDAESRSVATLLYGRFADLNIAFERAIGTSPRFEVLKALTRLTPPGCETASTQEIYIELLVHGIKVSKQVVANTLDYLKRQSAVTGGRYSQTAWWSLTPQGRGLLRKTEDDDARRRCI